MSNTTFATALISSAKPLTENILASPLIKFSFSGLKLKLLGLRLSPFPIIDCVSIKKIMVGTPKIAEPVSIIVKPRQEFAVFAENNSSG